MNPENDRNAGEDQSRGQQLGNEINVGVTRIGSGRFRVDITHPLAVVAER